MRNAYSTGLLRNLGRVVINNYAGAVRYPGASSGKDLPLWELATYDINGAEVGALLLEHWRFSPETIGAVRAVYHPALATDAILITAMLHVAAAVAEGWGVGLPGEQRLWQEDPTMLSRAGLSEDSAREAIAIAQEKFGRIAGIQWADAA